jgi:hypothetical protein
MIIDNEQYTIRTKTQLKRNIVQSQASAASISEQSYNNGTIASPTDSQISKKRKIT